MNNPIGSSRFDDPELRTWRSTLAVAGIVCALCATHPASAKDGLNVPDTVTCSSDNGQWHYCKADTRSGVRLIRQAGGSRCQPADWGYDRRGVWVDRGCQAEFNLSSLPGSHRDGFQTRTVGVGTDIPVRNNESIDVQKSDGQAFSGAVYQDVLDEKGDVAIPKGSYAKLVVKSTSDEALALELESVEVNGVRYEVRTDGYRTDGEPRGLEENARIGNVVDGARFLSAFTQLLAPGRTVKIPAQSFLTFHLKQSLAMGTGEDLTHSEHH